MSKTIQVPDESVDQDWTDVVCRFWDKTSLSAAEQRLHSESLVAAQPLALRVRTALLVGNRAILDSEWKELLTFWLECCGDEHETVKSNAEAWLRDVKDQCLRDAICRTAWKDNCITAQTIAVSSKYIPSAEDECSLFYFYSNQWGELERSDPDLKSLTKGYHAHCSIEIRNRFCSIARKHHRKELVIAMTRNFEAIIQLSDYEFETAIKVLAVNNEIDLLIRFVESHASRFSDKLWQECLEILKPQPESLWKLAAFTPVFWGMKCLELLKSWESPDPETKIALDSLLQLIPELDSSPKLKWRWLGNTYFSSINSDGISVNDKQHKLIISEPYKQNYVYSSDAGISLHMPFELDLSYLYMSVPVKPESVFWLSHNRSNKQYLLNRIARLTAYPDRFLLSQPGNISSTLLNNQLDLLESYADEGDRKYAEAVFAVITWAQQKKRLLKNKHLKKGAYRLLTSDDLTVEATQELTQEADSG